MWRERKRLSRDASNTLIRLLDILILKDVSGTEVPFKLLAKRAEHKVLIKYFIEHATNDSVSHIIEERHSYIYLSKKQMPQWYSKTFLTTIGRLLNNQCNII